MVVREAVLTFGVWLLAPTGFVLSGLLWLYLDDTHAIEHRVMALSGVETLLPLMVIAPAVRLLMRDASLGTAEVIAIRGKGYRARACARLSVLIAWIVIAAAPLAAVVSNELGVSLWVVLLAWLPTTLLFASAAAVLAIAIRSELAAAVLLGGWWLANVSLPSAMPKGIPASVINLLTYQLATDHWETTKLIQLMVAVLLGLAVAVLAPLLIRSALTNSVAL